MNKSYANLVFVMVFALLVPSIGLAERGIRVGEKRLALVFGNAGYKAGPLRNPATDANDMAVTLNDLGFEVMHKENSSQREMENAIHEFGRRLKEGDVGLFYFAGHGVQVKGRNYLIPLGAEIREETDVKYEAVDVGRVLDAMYNAGNNVNIVILDACRDNPFARSFRSSSSGLAQIDAPKGTLIAYSTSPGRVALDGTGRNSPYTGALLNYMKTRDLTIEQVFKKTRREIDDVTGGKQTPWESTSLIGDFYFSTKRTAARADKVEGVTGGDELDQERKQLERERQEIERLRVELERKKLEAERRRLEAEEKGLEIASLPPEIGIKSRLGMVLKEVDDGLEIVHVEENGPGKNAGLKDSDIILEMNQGAVRRLDDFGRKIQHYRENDTILLLVRRGNSTLFLIPKLSKSQEALEAEKQKIAKTERTPPIQKKGPRGWLGVAIQEVTPETRKHLGLDHQGGALVADLLLEGPAKKAGIERGDVIVSFDGKEITEVKALPPIVASTPVGKTVEVEVIRRGRTKLIFVKIGELKK